MTVIPLVTDQLRSAVARFATLAPFSRYVDPARIAVTALRGRSGPTGKRAECHFTRFRDTQDRHTRDGRWRLPEISLHGVEIRYVISFVFPRFLFLSAEEQAKDIVHELLHIHERFDGTGSERRHGVAYDRSVERIADRATAQGILLPDLARDGDVIYYSRFRPFPRPFRIGDRNGRATFDENDLEIAALRLDTRDRAPPPARFVYECPVCCKLYRRQRALRLASCGTCSDSYDARFKLVLRESRREEIA